MKTKVLPGQICFEELKEPRAVRDQRRLVKKIKIDLEATHTRLVFAVDNAKALKDAGQAGGEELENLIKACGMIATASEKIKTAEQ